jgi:DNA invertase Pin-like site-specific DNA recombinase
MSYARVGSAQQLSAPRPDDRSTPHDGGSLSRERERERDLPYVATAIAAASGQDVALYARVSGGEQEKQATIDSQLDGLRLAVQRCGGRIVAEYIDNPYTGTVRRRPALDRLMADAWAGKFTALLIHDPDRLARGKPYLRPMLEEELRDMGITVAYLSYEVEDTPAGHAKDGMTTVFNEWEREVIVGRMQRGKRHKLDKGFIWRGPRPYGWLYHKPQPGHQHGRLEHHPDEAPIVQEIIVQAAMGVSGRHIGADLTRRRILSLTGKEWDPATVYAVIHNPLHSGRVVVNRYEVVAPDPQRKRTEYPKRGTKSSCRERPRDQWVFIDPETLAQNGIVIPPIVSAEVQDAAEAALARNTYFASRHAKRPYPLRGLVYCMRPSHDDPAQPCGRRMVGSTTRNGRYRQYRCRHTYHGVDGAAATHCTTARSADLLEVMVWEHITRVLREPDVLRQSLALAAQGESAERARAEQAVARAQAALQDADDALDGLLDLASRTRLDPAAFARRQADYVRQRDLAREAMEAAQQYLVGLRAAGARWDTICAWLHELAGLLEEAERPGNEHTKERIIRAMTYRIEIDDHETRYIGWLEQGEEEKSASSRSAIAEITS